MDDPVGALWVGECEEEGVDATDTPTPVTVCVGDAEADFDA